MRIQTLTLFTRYAFITAMFSVSLVTRNFHLLLAFGYVEGKGLSEDALL